MKSSKALKAILLVSGLIAAGIGGAILVVPEAFYASYGIDLGGNVSLLNEIRAPGGALLAAGILIISGSFVASLTFTALVVASLLYLSYGLSRILSFVIDGMPAEGLVQAAALELVVGMFCVFALLRNRAKQKASA
ncbi:MAG: DUF4345 domain-containing protein [Pseudomonadota bacterium]